MLYMYVVGRVNSTLTNTNLCNVIFIRNYAHPRWWFIVYTHYIPEKIFK